MTLRNGEVSEVLARVQGRCGELVLRRSGVHLEIICAGAFLISTRNEASSRALIAAAAPELPPRPLDVLIGGLGVGHALDEALDLPRLRSVTVVEIEPVVIEWFARYGGARAQRAFGDRRVHLECDDVLARLVIARQACDLIALDTDNGPEWLMRTENAGLYAPHGLRRVRTALRPGGVAVFWATGYDDRFAARLQTVFGAVTTVEAVDMLDGRPLTFLMYVCRRP